MHVCEKTTHISAEVLYQAMTCAVGPASYVVNASDLKAVTAGNVLCK